MLLETGCVRKALLTGHTRDGRLRVCLRDRIVYFGRYPQGRVGLVPDEWEFRDEFPRKRRFEGRWSLSLHLFSGRQSSFGSRWMEDGLEVTKGG